LKHLGICLEGLGLLARRELDKTGAGEAARSPDALFPIAEPLEGLPGQARFGLQIVVHTHQAAGATGGTGCQMSPFQHGDFYPAAAEVERQARAMRTAADDEDVERCCGHRMLQVRIFSRWAG
jgi:hypothetical protein